MPALAIDPATAAQFAATLRDPVGFSRGVLGDDLWATQEAILRALAKPHARVAVRACHSSGKTRVSSAAAVWFPTVFEEGIVVTTAPTWPQVELLLWGEIHAALGRAKIQYPEPNKTEWFLSRRNYAVGLSTNEGVRFQGFHCLADDHEILTRRGWLGIDDVREDDAVLSLPRDGDVASWQPITAVHRYPGPATIHEFHTRSVSFAVTGEHRLLFRGQSGGWRLKPWREAPQKFWVRRASGWEGQPFDVPEPFAALGWGAERVAAFIGFWLAEGSVRQHHQTGRFYEVILHQAKADGVTFVHELLDGVRFSHCKDEWSVSNRAIAAWLMAECGRYQHERRIPRVLLDAPPAVLRALLDAFVLGDGRRRAPR